MRHRTRSFIALGAVAALSLGATASLVSSASAASTVRALALSSNGFKLTNIDLRTGALIKTVGTVQGLQGDTKLIGIDFRVQDKKFYGVGNQGGVYRIVVGTGKATKASQLSVPLDGSKDYAVDFNPAADRLRVISTAGQNLRHDLNTNETIADTPLAISPAAEGQAPPEVSAVAYTNNDLDAATATTLFDIDTNLDQLFLQSPANAGTLVNIGKLGVNVTSVAGFDIQTTKAGANIGYAVLRTSSGVSGLYKVDLLSGKVTRVGFFKNDVADLAVPQP